MPRLRLAVYVKLIVKEFRQVKGQAQKQVGGSKCG